MEITVTKIKTKDGEGKKGPWKLTKWTDEAGTVWSTFDKKARGVGVGAVVDIPEWDSDEYGNDFQKWTLVAEATPEIAAAAQATNGAAEQEKTLSIERQSTTASFLEFCGKVVAAGLALSPLQQEGLDKAFIWGTSRYDDAPAVDARTITVTRVGARSESDKAFDKLERDSRFLTVGELRKWCAENGVDTAKFCELVKVKEADIPKVNIDEAYQVIKDYLAEKGG